jgi:hypothetical protein
MSSRSFEPGLRRPAFKGWPVIALESESRQQAKPPAGDKNFPLSQQSGWQVKITESVPIANQS